MTSILDGALERGPFAGEGGRTGVEFERAVLSDGTPVIVKHASRDDWLARVAGDVMLPKLWAAGVFERVPASIEHTMITVEPSGDEFLIVMRDISDSLLGDHRVLTRDEHRRILSVAASLYEEFWGEDVPGCGIHEHYACITPKGSMDFMDSASPIPPLIVRGWELFDQVAPGDVVDVVNVLLDDPKPLTDEIKNRPTTLIHGDLRLHNMGLRPEHVVLFDWEVAGPGIPAMDFTWYLIISATRVDASREQMIDDFRTISADRFDARALELGLIGAFIRLGWNKALDIVENPDPSVRAQERADLDWWIARLRVALEEWSPV